LGPSAHSFNGQFRQWNISNNANYVKQIKLGQVPLESETLSKRDLYNEYIMTGLRLLDGISKKHILSFGQELSDHFDNELDSKLSKGCVIRSGDRIYLPADQRFFADGHASDLFFLA
jgi:oxygen-independent coproporphyrinogen-3 oxidase